VRGPVAAEPKVRFRLPGRRLSPLPTLSGQFALAERSQRFAPEREVQDRVVGDLPVNRCGRDAVDEGGPHGLACCWRRSLQGLPGRVVNVVVPECDRLTDLTRAMAMPPVRQLMSLRLPAPVLIAVSEKAPSSSITMSVAASAAEPLSLTRVKIVMARFPSATGSVPAARNVGMPHCRVARGRCAAGRRSGKCPAPYRYVKVSRRGPDHPLTPLAPPGASHGGTEREQHAAEIGARGRMAWQKANGYGRRALVETASPGSSAAAASHPVARRIPAPEKSSGDRHGLTPQRPAWKDQYRPRATPPADIDRNGRPTSIRNGWPTQAESPADSIGMRTALFASGNCATIGHNGPDWEPPFVSGPGASGTPSEKSEQE
jgi:hypothetical protein